MRVLIAHNAYQHRGGEDSVAESEITMLRAHGHEVQTYRRHNDELAGIGRASAALQAVWSSRTTAEVEQCIGSFKPDVIHVHNTMPLISPSIYWTAQRFGVPVVQTLHNFRLICPQAMLLREGRVCEDCVGKLPWRGVVHGCYRGSVAQTGVMALMLTTHRLLGTWQHKVTRYIALNEFARAKYIRGGLPGARISVKPNFVDVPALSVPRGALSREGLLFVGRLSEEKGIALLLDAFARLSPGQTLRVVGSGPLEPWVRDQLPRLPGLHCLGPLPAEQVYAQMRRSAALVLPSICYENFPRTIVEAFACGLPVIASDLGALPSIVRQGQTGLLFQPGDAEALAACITAATSEPESLRQMGLLARDHYERELTGATNYRQLLTIYAQAIDEVSAAKRGC